jgi:hypothetical protein
MQLVNRRKVSDRTRLARGMKSTMNRMRHTLPTTPLIARPSMPRPRPGMVEVARPTMPIMQASMPVT